MRKKITLIAIIVALILTLFTAFSFATQIEPRTSINEPVITIEGEDIVTGEEITQDTEYEIIEQDFYIISDENYTMDQLVDGNAYLIVDGDITFSGNVLGSVYILANGTVEFTEESKISDAIYILAQNVKVNTIEVYDIYSASESFELMENSYVSRDLRAIASNIKLRGNIYRDVYLNAENIDVKDGETELFIGGDFNYSSPAEIEGIQDVVKYGNVNFSLQENEMDETVVETTSDKIKSYSINALTSAVYVIVIYGILKLISPKFIEKSGADLKEKSIVAFSVGLLTWVIIVLAIVVSIILIFTPLCSPISIISWIVMLVIICASSAVFSISILEVIKQKVEKIRGNVGLEIAVLAGIAIFVWLLQELPYIGGVVSSVVITTGIGLIIRNAIAKRATKTEEATTTIVEETNTPTEENDTQE